MLNCFITDDVSKGGGDVDKPYAEHERQEQIQGYLYQCAWIHFPFGICAPKHSYLKITARIKT